MLVSEIQGKSKPGHLFSNPRECLLTVSAEKTHGKDDAKLVAARTADGAPFCELLFNISRLEEKIFYLEPIIVYF